MYLQIENLSKTISKAAILQNLSLEMDRGKIYGLWGKNGSGKTMLIRAICGLIHPSEGTITIDGVQLGRDIAFPRSVGALIESPGFIAGYSGIKNLRLLADIQRKIGDDEIRSAMTALQLDPDDRKKFKKYSLGMKQKLGIAAAIMEKPDILLLDEPFNALDEKSAAAVAGFLLEEKKRGALIVLSCHDKEELEALADEVFCLENGRLTNQYTVRSSDTQEDAK